MKEVLTTQSTAAAGYSNAFVNNNGETSGDNNATNDNNSRKYAMLSTEWISMIGEELGMHPLPDSVLRRLAEDASYRLREVLHKCVIRLKHSRKKRLTSEDVNAVITNLCNTDPIIGIPDTLPEFHSEARVFVPHERVVDLIQRVNEPFNISQTNQPFLQEFEICDPKLTEARNNYAKRALKTLFNGSQKTFQVLLNDCATNEYLGGQGVIDKLMHIARSMVISNNAQYTRVSTRTCQLIIAIASNTAAIYPYHLTSVEKLTELLLELLLGQSFINPNLELLFKECALKLMLRWPSVADKFIPTLENSMFKEEREVIDNNRKRTVAMELLTTVQPLILFQSHSQSPLSVESLLNSAPPGSVLWERIALAICAFGKSQPHILDYSCLTTHYGDSLIPYLPRCCFCDSNKSPVLPIIIKNKMKYVNVMPMSKNHRVDRQSIFPDSTLRGPRREIRFAFAGGRPVPPNNLRRVSLRANYQILRNDLDATLALVASRRLLALKDRRRMPVRSYHLSHTHL